MGLDAPKFCQRHIHRKFREQGPFVGVGREGGRERSPSDKDGDILYIFILPRRVERFSTFPCHVIDVRYITVRKEYCAKQQQDLALFQSIIWICTIIAMDMQNLSEITCIFVTTQVEPSIFFVSHYHMSYYMCDFIFIYFEDVATSK